MYQQTIINNRCVLFIISLIGQVRAHKTSLTPSRFIEVSVPSQESVRSYLCVRDIDFASFHDFFRIVELFRRCGIFFVFDFISD